MAQKKDPKTNKPAEQKPENVTDITRNQRQSAPKPTAREYLNTMNQGQNMSLMGAKPMAQGQNMSLAKNGFQAINEPIGKEFLHMATQTLMKYKEGKANLEKRIIEDEQWYKLRHWECLRKSKNDQVEPTSAWLFNCIANKHADAMDNFPSPNILPREEGDKGEAEMLSSVIPVILDQCDFEQAYDDAWNYKLKSGTAVYGVFWDSTLLHGLGDISIKQIDLINLFWESGIKDIQKSKYLFHVELIDNDQLVRNYPQLATKLTTSTIDIAKYVYDDSVDTSEKSCVVDMYYKKANSQGKKVLHYVKYVNDEVLFATENNPDFADRGFYDHAEYPFVFDVLFPVEGTPTGFGYIDVGKSAQEFIDRGNQAIMKSMLTNARPRYFIRADGAVNEGEYADLTNDFIHVDGNLGVDSILPVSNTPFSNTWVDVLQYKIDELKETTGNRDVATGGTTSGVTAASGIAAMQEASSKLSRDANKSAYRAFRHIVLLCIELIRQFYDLPRCFRIMGQNGAMRFVQYSNQNLVAQQQGIEFGVDLGVRVPYFDVEVTAQKQSPYSKMAQNELALQFYSAGFFNPQMAGQALACMDMMDFDRKEFVMQKIQQNGGMLQQMMMLAQMADQSMGTGGEITNSLASQYGLAVPNTGNADTKQNENLGGEGQDESEYTKQARQRVAESTSPR